MLDFGASRDGIPVSMRGSRKLVRSEETRITAVVSDDEDAA